MVASIDDLLPLKVRRIEGAATGALLRAPYAVLPVFTGWNLSRYALPEIKRTWDIVRANYQEIAKLPLQDQSSGLLKIVTNNSIWQYSDWIGAITPFGIYAQDVLEDHRALVSLDETLMVVRERHLLEGE